MSYERTRTLETGAREMLGLGPAPVVFSRQRAPVEGAVYGARYMHGMSPEAPHARIRTRHTGFGAARALHGLMPHQEVSSSNAVAMMHGSEHAHSQRPRT